MRLLPRLRTGQSLRLGLDFVCEFPAADAAGVESDLRQAIEDLRLGDELSVITE